MTAPAPRARDIAAALRDGADRLYASLDDPREGTILTVARDAAAAAERAAADSADIGEFMRRLLGEGEAALARTPELMAVLKEAGVVDAGGKGFVRMLEGVVRYIEGDPILAVAAAPAGAASLPAALVEVAAERDFQFCTEVLVRGEQLPPANEVRAAMHTFGGSVRGGGDRPISSRSMCTPIPPRPSLAMRRGGAGSRPPRRTTCGRSTGGLPTRSAARSRW